ncbi:hypothetical protein Ahy_A05g024409 [Arachis hypogaea]|uniref:Protein FAR1-RELATED SEQUENCE n=1 Tax=Arachis hypogaea TaxID=3818 RepID=A0A445D6D9_ARAHY|nr:hypothetical protein Ahy_A05g024409 [Arachis hypogaea]
MPFFGDYLYCKVGRVQFVHEYDNVLGNKEQKEREDDAADSKGVVTCSSSSTIERQFQREYTTPKFRKVQLKFRKRGDCLVRGVTQEGNLFWVTVNEQYLLDGGAYVLDVKCRNVQQKHTFIKSSHDEKRLDKSHNLFRRLCSHFYNVASDFVTCEEEALMLHSGLDQLRAKLLDCRANLGSRCVPTTQNSMVTQHIPALGESDIQGPSKVSTKGRPRLKRLGSELDTSIKKQDLEMFYSDELLWYFVCI